MGNRYAKMEPGSTANAKSSSSNSLFKGRFKMCPTKQKQVTMKDQQNNLNNRPQLSLPIEGIRDEKENEWTEVLLHVPSSPPGELSKERPHAPPRKHRHSTPASSPAPIPEVVQVNHYNQLNARLQHSIDKVPVQEEIIIPKKEPIHICDGTHKHCINIVNGKVIESTIPQKSTIITSKTISSSSLPNYDDLLGKDNNTANQKNRTSYSSLSSEKLPKYLNSTTEKLESYITRWQSFGSIFPNNKKNTKNIANVENKMIASDESWDGSDLWAQNVIESDIVVEPDVPTVKKRSRGSSHTNQETKKILKSADSGEEKTNNHTGSTDLPNNVNEVSNQAVDNVSNTNLSPVVEMCEDLKTFPFKAEKTVNVFECDLFFTSEFLKRENEASSLQLQPYISHARTCTFKDDVDKLSAEILDGKSNEYSSECGKSTQVLNETTKNEDSDKLLALKDFCDQFDELVPKNCSVVESVDKKERPIVAPRRKSGIGHSNLLKILQQNFSGSISSTELVKSTEEQSKSLPGIQVVEHVHEPKITPELKSIV